MTSVAGSTRGRSWLRRVVLAIGTLLLAAVLAFLVGTWWFFQFGLAPKTDLADYDEYLDALRPGYTDHFPRPIPSAAQTVQLYYQPGFLQGGTILKLHFIAPLAHLESVRRALEPRALVRWFGSNRPLDTKYALPELKLPPREGVTHELPHDYEVIVLAASPSADWNHANFAGIAISDKRRAILYWAEDW